MTKLSKIYSPHYMTLISKSIRNFIGFIIFFIEFLNTIKINIQKVRKCYGKVTN